MTTDTQTTPAPARRTDIWVDAFDGKYRLFLGIAQLVELERRTGHIDKEGNQHGGSIFAVYDRVSKGRYELDGKSVGFASEGQARLTDCRETVRLALVGGGHALVNGEKVKVGPRRAIELVETYLNDAPLEEVWTLAFLMLSAVISGREEKPYEVGYSSTTAVYPPSPNDDATEDEKDNRDKIDADDAIAGTN